MGNSSEFNVTRLSSLIGVVNAWSGPALTQYGQVRVELGGPVVARWLSKVANYLTTEIAADLFGSGEPTPARIYTSLQPWQDVLWQIAARAMGWEYLDTRRPLPGDLLVTNSLNDEANTALESGAHVLAQAPTYLSFAWMANSAAPWMLSQKSRRHPTPWSSTLPRRSRLHATRPWLGYVHPLTCTDNAWRYSGKLARVLDRCSISGWRGARS